MLLKFLSGTLRYKVVKVASLVKLAFAHHDYPEGVGVSGPCTPNWENTDLRPTGCRVGQVEPTGCRLIGCRFDSLSDRAWQSEFSHSENSKYCCTIENQSISLLWPTVVKLCLIILLKLIHLLF
jgi:hypothetical protein